MKLKNQLPISRLIGKIDNDFNLGDSDWIPRVGAWTIDALNQMNILPRHRVRRIFSVNNRFVTLPEIANLSEVRVFDMNGCEIPMAKRGSCGCANETNSTSQEILVNADTAHGGIQSTNHITVYDEDGNEIPYSEIAGIYYTRDIYSERSVIKKITNNCNRNFVLECRTIEFNFDIDKVIVESLEALTYHDDYYNECMPYIYDDGLLLEALAWYCLFKHLSRGSKHPVYSLTSPNQILNPYSHWMDLKNKAKASVLNHINNDDKVWNSFFYNSTFRPRD